jgi:hypothetical protein
MLCYLISCNEYKVIRGVNVRDLSELPSLCRVEEEKRNDEYAVYANHNGQMVADSDGVHENFDDNSSYTSSIDMACGYDNI